MVMCIELMQRKGGYFAEVNTILRNLIVHV